MLNLVVNIALIFEGRQLCEKLSWKLSTRALNSSFWGPWQVTYQLCAIEPFIMLNIFYNLTGQHLNSLNVVE